MNAIACNNAAGNLTTDQRGYSYEYHHENRIVKITEGQTDIAEYSYDALGRRVEKKDCVTSANTRRYYYDKDWRVVNDYDGSNNPTRQYLWGNYIDEVLFSWGTALTPPSMRFYAHDHLYSPVTLLSAASAVIERYEAACPDIFLVGNACGEPNILDGSYNPRSPQVSTCDNSYLFTGRQVDILDGGALKIQYNRNRYCDYYTGRADLKITHIKKTCGCTVAELAKRDYAPGESGVVKVSYTSSKATAAMQKNIYVSTNDPANPMVTLTAERRDGAGGGPQTSTEGDGLNAPGAGV